MAEGGYSKLVSWEVHNFMAYDYAKAEFDDRNIVVIKGYNDSGKSAMLQALNVLMFNIKAKSQVGFIKDDKDYFRIIAHFDDGVSILRDKYINGQSLYEMYKDGNVIFSTKEGNTLTKVSEVPEPIEKYLGLISHDGTCLNSRSCIEKQLLVQTTGSENYKLLNVILKSEELAIATQMLNDDKNKLVQDINYTEAKLQASKEFLGVGAKISDELLKVLEEEDKNFDLLEQRTSSLVAINNLGQNISSISISPELNTVDCGQIDIQALNLLYTIDTVLYNLSMIPDLPQVEMISTEQFDMICKINDIVKNIEANEQSLSEVDDRLRVLDEESANYTSMLKEFGKTVVKCPNCGTIYDTEQGHEHIGL